MEKINILSIPLDRVSRAEALTTVEAFIDSGQPHQVTTVNAEFIVDAQTNSAFRQVLQTADLSLADSIAVIWAARWLGQPSPERIAGADFVHDLVRVGSQKKWHFYLIGGSEGVAEAAADRLKSLYPGLSIVGAEVGLLAKQSSDKTELQALIGRITSAKPDILLVAFGAPKQDLFIAEHKSALGIPVMIGVGGTLDFLAGRITRAPELFRQAGLEWLWRLVLQPSRFKRITKAVVIFPWLVLTQRNKK